MKKEIESMKPNPFYEPKMNTNDNNDNLEIIYSDFDNNSLKIMQKLQDYLISNNLKGLSYDEKYDLILLEHKDPKFWLIRNNIVVERIDTKGFKNNIYYSFVVFNQPIKDNFMILGSISNKENFWANPIHEALIKLKSNVFVCRGNPDKYKFWQANKFNLEHLRDKLPCNGCKIKFTCNDLIWRPKKNGYYCYSCFLDRFDKEYKDK